MPRYAAVDIGSNSVRMLAAEVTPAPQGGFQMRSLAVDRQITRLGQSVFRQGRISAEAEELVCSMLVRMAQTYAKCEVIGVRAVATSATRDASNQQEFLDHASQALGAPIEVISGQEEARLIHLGVVAKWPELQGRVLMIDVGGGSAEFIVSEGGELQEGVSKPLGAVRLTELFMKSDPPDPLELQRMETFIDERMTGLREQFGAAPFDTVVITSASAGAVVCAANQVPRVERETADRLSATAQQIRQVYQALGRSTLAERKRMVGIGPRRAEIVVAGAAVFVRALDLFAAPALVYSTAGVREGIIADLALRGVGRERARLSAEQRGVCEEMAQKYNVPSAYANSVACFANDLFDATASLHKLPPYYGKLLEAAALLHNTGHFIADTGHHKHSYYLVANSDLPGFTTYEREFIALLCRYHRKSMPGPRHEAYNALSIDARGAMLLLVPLLRMAIGLDIRHEQTVTGIRVETRPDKLVIALDAKANPELELWATERAGVLFADVYHKPVTVVRVK